MEENSIKSMANPYDFANPVTDETVFAGRDTEMSEIRYYLGHAMSGAKPINIALLGQRASGKTSILNMTEIEAKRCGFCTVRVNLDEDDGASQLRFFYKLFDAVLTAACELGAYGGITGRTYDTYLDMTSAYLVPDSKEYCPFVFPIQYAKAMASGRTTISVSDTNYEKDLAAIQNVLGKPVLVLFDEANVLSHSRAHLQKLRNMSMQLSGYMLVLTGTPELFPMMSEVFSPIIRQFKKIEVGQFKTQRDTQACMTRPLEKHNLEVETVFDYRTYREISEMHDLSGGRPYEIQLICHMMFKRVQEQHAKRMILDWAVLEDVRHELETSQDVSTRPTLLQVRRMEKWQLDALRVLCVGNGKIGFNTAWTIEYLWNGEERWAKAQLESELQTLIGKGVLRLEGDVISFCGDDFDRLYTKYLARNRGIALSFGEGGLETAVGIRIIRYLDETCGMAVLGGGVDRENSAAIDKIIAKIGDGIAGDHISGCPLPLLRSVYNAIFDNQGKSEIRLCRLVVSIMGMRLGFWAVCKSRDAKSSNCGGCSGIRNLEDRACSVGARIQSGVQMMRVIDMRLFVQAVAQSQLSSLSGLLIGEHARKMYESYRNGNLEAAISHAQCLRYFGDHTDSVKNSWRIQNDLGYVFMASSEYDTAKVVLDKALSLAKNRQEAALSSYNKSVLCAMMGDYTKARERLDIAAEQVGRTGEDGANTVELDDCILFVPAVQSDGQVTFVEERGIDLGKAIESAVGAMSGIGNNPAPTFSEVSG